MKLFENKEDIAKKIKRKRECLGIEDQKKFAELLGIKPSQYNRYEKGKQRPRDEALKRILEYGGLGSEIETILEPVVSYEIQTIEQKKLLDNVVEILDSGNDTMIDALKANIKAFLEAVRMTKKNEDKGGG